MNNLMSKEKAEELVNKFQYAKKYSNSQNSMSFELAKQCALIAVDEIIKAGKDVDEFADSYWQEVKEEIIKL